LNTVSKRWPIDDVFNFIDLFVLLLSFNLEFIGINHSRFLLLHDLITQLPLLFQFLLSLIIMPFNWFNSFLLLECPFIIRNITNSIFEVSNMKMLVHSVIMVLNCFVMILIYMIHIVLMIKLFFFSNNLIDLLFSIWCIFVPLLEFLFLFLLLLILLFFRKLFIELIMVNSLIELIFFMIILHFLIIFSIL
jgi:hypothetical protein